MKRNTIIIIILSILTTLAGFFWYVIFYIKKKSTNSNTIPQTANQDLGTSKDINLSGILNRLDALEYVPIDISAFTLDIPVRQKGYSVNSIVFSYTINKQSVSMSINNNIGVVTNPNSWTTTGLNITSNTTFILTAIDEKGTIATKSASIRFDNKMYWGSVSSMSPTDAQIKALPNGVLVNSRQRNVNMAGNGQHLAIAFEASLGTPSFIMGGLPNTDWTITQRDFVNELGYSSLYNICVMGTVQNSSNIPVTIQ